MKKLLYFSILSGVLYFGQCTPAGDTVASFVATLGSDTMVIESFTITPKEVHAEVVIRTPRTSYITHHLVTDVNDKFLSFESTTYDPSDIEGGPFQIQTVAVEGDSLLIVNKRDTTERISKTKYNGSIVPWIDMVHWPYEFATRRMKNKGESEVDQLMLAGSRARVFELRSICEDTISIKHPSRGTMMAAIDEKGAILTHDATNTTRKLIVKRGGDIDMKRLASYYADKPIGSLSGAAYTESTVQGAKIKLTFGQPARRGRELFGGIVPWNKRWRTGANRATHFTTDKGLKFGNLDVPAGEYTLFTIPEPDGGSLIINQQTGQNGRSYDASRDLGRVPMRLVKSEESVELFTIDAIERGDKGILQLKWGETIFEVEFIVKG
jgi:hypothetical protein